jgi:RNA polymerase sigma-B factor
VATPDLSARGRAIERHLPLVRSLARRYAERGEGLEDLVQVGAVGLINAVDRFDPHRGPALAALAIPSIEGEIRRHLRDRAAPVRIPRRLQEESALVRRTEGALAASLRRPPTAGELARATGLPPRQLDRARLAAAARTPAGLAGPAGEDRLPDPVDPVARAEARVAVRQAFAALEVRERRILHLRFFAELTQAQIAAQTGLSQVHVSRLIAGALAKLRAELATPPPPDRPLAGRGRPS